MSWHVLENPAKPGSYVRVAVVRQDTRSVVWAGWPAGSARMDVRATTVAPRGSRAAHASSATTSSEMVAAMAARVVLVAKKQGDPVAAGQVLVVLEAMKTEIPLVAQQNGVVGRILCEPGEQVSEGQVLICLEAVAPVPG